MGTVSPKEAAGHEFHWTQSSEPHSQRRREMLAKYGPQIRQLYGYDHWTAYQVGVGGTF